MIRDAALKTKGSGGPSPAGTRRRFDVEIWSKCGRDIDRLNFDVVSTSPCRRVI